MLITTLEKVLKAYGLVWLLLSGNKKCVVEEMRSKEQAIESFAILGSIKSTKNAKNPVKFVKITFLQ